MKVILTPILLLFSVKVSLTPILLLFCVKVFLTPKLLFSSVGLLFSYAVGLFSSYAVGLFSSYAVPSACTLSSSFGESLRVSLYVWPVSLLWSHVWNFVLPLMCGIMCHVTAYLCNDVMHVCICVMM